MCFLAVHDALVLIRVVEVDNGGPIGAIRPLPHDDVVLAKVTLSYACLMDATQAAIYSLSALRQQLITCCMKRRNSATHLNCKGKVYNGFPS